MTRCEMGPGEVRRSPIEVPMSAPTAAPQLAVLRPKTRFISDFLVKLRLLTWVTEDASRGAESWPEGYIGSGRDSLHALWLACFFVGQERQAPSGLSFMC